MGVTISQVARAAGVSTATVSRVVSGRGPATEAISARVWATVNELGYQPNRVARRLRVPGKQMWALVVPDIENPFFTSIARGLEDSALEFGVTVFLGNTDDLPDKELRYLDTAIAEQVGGVVLAPSSPNVDISVLLRARVPVVIVDQVLENTDVDTVTSDNFAGGQIAGAELIRLGYTRVAAILGPATEPSWNERLRGVQEAMNAGGGEVVRVERNNNRVDGGLQSMQRLLESGVDFQAVFVSNNLMTVGAMRALDAAGKLVPRDVGIIGFDLSVALTTHAITLTSIDQDSRQMGHLAGQYLAESLLGVPSPPRSAVLTPRLVTGDSLRHQ
ncbi:LacI family DNA-binding transcriptional regulator [soil metagenome]